MAHYKWQTPVLSAEWDNELVLFHKQSGDTYLFADSSKEIVSYCLLKERFSNDELLADYLDRIDSQEQQESIIQSVIDQMVRANLIAKDTL